MSNWGIHIENVIRQMLAILFMSHCVKTCPVHSIVFVFYRRKQLLGLNDDKLRKSAEPSKPGERHTTESVGRAGLIYTSPDVLQQKTHVSGGRETIGLNEVYMYQ